MQDSIKNFLTVPFLKDNIDLYVGPKIKRKGMLNNIDGSPDFPKEFYKSENKLLYVLWQEGEVPDYDLKMLSNLDNNQFTEAVNKLLSDRRIEEISYKITPNDPPTLFYRLV